MTVMTKPITVKKIPLIEDPFYEEEVVEVAKHVHIHRRPTMAAALCFATCSFVLLLLGAVSAFQVFQQYTNEQEQRNHYQGYCSIPIPRDLQQLDAARKMSLRWKTSNNAVHSDPEIQVVSLMEEEPGSEYLMDLLREVLDIDVDQSVEKISVVNNGHPVSFVHDFESNFTGIVDSERCFTMELDPTLVLSPELLVWSLERGSQFDVSSVRSSVRAALPAIHHTRVPTALKACRNKPVYKLQKNEGVVIRKRSADAPPHDYMHFSGNRIQEIQISNLPELLQYEQNNKPVA